MDNGLIRTRHLMLGKGSQPGLYLFQMAMRYHDNGERSFRTIKKRAIASIVGLPSMSVNRISDWFYFRPRYSANALLKFGRGDVLYVKVGKTRKFITKEKVPEKENEENFLKENMRR